MEKLLMKLLGKGKLAELIVLFCKKDKSNVTIVKQFLKQEALKIVQAYEQ
jgi:hypothetical protein